MATEQPTQAPLPSTTVQGVQTTQETAVKKDWKDCQSCRLTGFATFTGVGGYAIYTAAQQGAFAKVRPKGLPLVAGKVQAAVGVVLIGLGIGRLFI